ncbi:DUF6029 family protein [Flavobacterium sp.]|jgi:hypothetical protein|uniref:DUF6029 family protein n=1 Tax=Flavobacterium sp. TaxID=239 RepID=UPI0037BE8F0B
MKKSLYLFLLSTSISIYAQENKFGKIFGGLESNSQWYLNDKGQQTVHPEDPLRSNNYLFLNYNLDKWSAGLQVESYEKNALLNYNPKYKGTNVATYFVNYKDKTFDLTAGYFYEQFGSGLILRSWEDRALGINNALRGVRAIIRPTQYLTFTTLYGQQRTGFDVSEAKIHGFNTEVDFGALLKFEKSQLSGGLSFVGRDEKTTIVNPDFDDMTNAISYRLNFSHNSFYISSELDTKSRDGVLSDANNNLSSKLVKTGNAFLLNMGYTKKGLGIDATFRRMQNMAFFSQRIPENGLIYNDVLMNFTPGLTKQQHLNTANIYVYQAQSKVDFTSNEVMKAGEIGGQIDVFYDAKKGSMLGGKYGTKFSFNSARWYNLDGNYLFAPSNYDTKLFSGSDKYYVDYNLEITKRFSPKMISGFTYINQFYNANFLAGYLAEVNTHILGLETTYSFTKSRSVRGVFDHMWADADRKNWASATLEYNANSKMSFYVSDLYNYGNDAKKSRTHYYNVGGSYRRGSSRIALNYGRQRGGLVCVGGVCRIVPESTGVSLSLNTSF